MDEPAFGRDTSNNATGLSSDEDDADGASVEEEGLDNGELDEEAAHATLSLSSVETARQP